MEKLLLSKAVFAESNVGSPFIACISATRDTCAQLTTTTKLANTKGLLLFFCSRSVNGHSNYPMVFQIILYFKVTYMYLKPYCILLALPPHYRLHRTACGLRQKSEMSAFPYHIKISKFIQKK